MNCIAKAERTWAQRIENRNTVSYYFGVTCSGIGIVLITLGVVYITSCLVNPVVTATISDSWIRTMAHTRYDITWIGLALFCLGALLKWRAEDSQTALEKTNRFR